MGQYQYEALTMTGSRQTGFIEAKDDTEARVKIRAKQLKPVQLKLVHRAGANPRCRRRAGAVPPRAVFERRPVRVPGQAGQP